MSLSDPEVSGSGSGSGSGDFDLVISLDLSSAWALGEWERYRISSRFFEKCLENLGFLKRVIAGDISSCSS